LVQELLEGELRQALRVEHPLGQAVLALRDLAGGRLVRLLRPCNPGEQHERSPNASDELLPRFMTVDSLLRIWRS
jgi:hypothetical protein